VSRRRPLRGALAVLAFAVPAQAPLLGQGAPGTPGERLPVRELTLENGMRFLILERDGAPTVSFVVEFAVGGVHERLGTTGIAHLLEHLLFKGTSSIGTRDVGSERVLFARMDAIHDTLLTARSVGDSARAEALAARIEELEDSARAYVEPNSSASPTWRGTQSISTSFSARRRRWTCAPMRPPTSSGSSR
jgi:hypothetical protein